MEGIVIRKMHLRDLPEVQAIENRSFTMPWQLNAFVYELGNRDSLLKVLIFNSRIIGYVCLRAVLDVVHVMDLAVASGFRQKGLGTMLLMNALQDMKELRPDANTVTLEVRESNTAAIRFYEKAGFKETGRRRGYYRKPLEDAVIMDRDFSS